MIVQPPCICFPCFAPLGGRFCLLSFVSVLHPPPRCLFARPHVFVFSLCVCVFLAFIFIDFDFDVGLFHAVFSGHYAAASVSVGTRKAYRMYMIRAYADLALCFRVRYKMRVYDCFIRYYFLLYYFYFFLPRSSSTPVLLGACLVTTDCIVAMN